MAKTTYLQTAAADYLVFPLSGECYGTLSSINAALSHAYDPKAERVLCGKVKPESILEDYEMVEETPSCPTCAARLAKLKAKASK